MNNLINKQPSAMAEYMMTIRQVFNTLITSMLCLACLLIATPNYAEELCFRETCKWGQTLHTVTGPLGRESNQVWLGTDRCRLDRGYYVNEFKVDRTSGSSDREKHENGSSTGNKLIKACEQSDRVLFNGDNTARVEQIDGHFVDSESRQRGWFEYEIHLELDGERIHNLCSNRFDSLVNNSRFNDCEDEFHISLASLDPGLQSRLKEAKDFIEELQQNRRAAEVEFNEKLDEVQAAIDSIADFPLDSFTRVHISQSEKALDLYDALRMDYNDLIRESNRQRNVLQESLSETQNIIENALIDSGYQPQDFQVNENFSPIRINIPDSIQENGFTLENNIYQQYADDVLEELMFQYEGGDFPAFIATADEWVASIDEFRQILQDLAFQSPTEWKAFNDAFYQVDGYIFGNEIHPAILDRDLWFSDSPVTVSQRQAIGHIKSAYPMEGGIIEDEVRTWRGKTVTQRQLEMLLALEALGNGIKELLVRDETPSKSIGSIVSGAAIAVKDASVCATKIIVTGDFGDFYEVVIGKDLCTGQALSFTERVISSAGFIVGSGLLWRGVAKTIGLLPSSKTVAKNNEDKAKVIEELGGTLKFRQRTLELALDPDRGQLLIREGIGAARFEIATGRKVTRSQDGATDFIDSKLGEFDLKGPLRANDGSPIEINDARIEGLSNSIIKEANHSTASRAVVVDTLGLTKEQIEHLKNKVALNLTTNKPIVYVE